MFDYLTAPFPYYWTAFDLIINVVAYFPFGLLLFFSIYPRLGRVTAAFLTVLTSVLLSMLMEMVQTYLPGRVPSSLDLLANSAGACMGALAGITFSIVLKSTEGACLAIPAMGV